MLFQEYVNQYDYNGNIVLLEGKSAVLPNDIDKLIALGKLLALSTQHIHFRSGNAEGSDFYFSQGVASIDKNRLQVITPYSGHRKSANYAAQTIPLDKINLVNESKVVYYSKKNKKTEKLIDQYVTGNVNSYTVKAAYIIRDTIKVLGASGIKPASFAIFYDDLANPFSGGTGHTMNVCKLNNIPQINQNVWFNWLK
jgi:hypothetical protein